MIIPSPHIRSFAILGAALFTVCLAISTTRSLAQAEKKSKGEKGSTAASPNSAERAAQPKSATKPTPSKETSKTTPEIKLPAEEKPVVGKEPTKPATTSPEKTSPPATDPGKAKGPPPGMTRQQGLMAGITIFVLAIFVGFELINKVPTTLHTPLMSGSNAISGITVVGALIAAAKGFSFASFLGFFAVALAMINVVGGFLVTHRMLLMFKRK